MIRRHDEQEEEQNDLGAVIHQPIPDVEGTEPRPIQIGQSAAAAHEESNVNHAWRAGEERSMPLDELNVRSIYTGPDTSIGCRAITELHRRGYVFDAQEQRWVKA